MPLCRSVVDLRVQRDMFACFTLPDNFVQAMFESGQTKLLVGEDVIKVILGNWIRGLPAYTLMLGVINNLEKCPLDQNLFVFLTCRTLRQNNWVKADDGISNSAWHAQE